MGTGFDMNSSEEEQGIIPRAIAHLFNGIQAHKQAAQDQGVPIPEFKVSAQFLEVSILVLKRVSLEIRGFRNSLIRQLGLVGGVEFLYFSV